MPNKLTTQLEALLESKAEELSRIKGFSLKSVLRGFSIIIPAIPEAIPEWMLATAQEKNDAVVFVFHKHWGVKEWIIDIAYHILSHLI
jgi:hypothetical protein